MFEAHKEAKTFAESFMRLENKDLRKRLAALQAENVEKDREIARLSEQLEADSQLKSGLSNANALCSMYKAALSRVEAERDAAVTYIEKRMVDDVVAGNEPCDICAMASDTPCESCTPKWRGAQEEG